MGFSTNDKMVRVDVFKESGKWYLTTELFWDRYNSYIPEEDQNNEDLMAGKLVETIHDTFERLALKQFAGRYQGMIAVCLEPYHEYAHPLMIRILK